MTKKKHPSNRYERLQLKEKIKQFGKGSNDRSGHVRRKLELEDEAVKEFEDEILAEQVRLAKENYSSQKPVERFNHI